jgi:hypothetical protein
MLTRDIKFGPPTSRFHCEGKLIQVIIEMTVNVVPYPDGAVPTAEEEKTA